MLILPLEDRFPPWNSAQGPPDGIVVLGGAIAPGISLARGAVALNNSAERITATVELARRYPNARIIFSGGTAALFKGPLEAPLAVKEFEALGVAHDRITAEEQSRNTIENAVFSRLIAQPKPGERWLLVTSAFHMPRAIAAFRAAGFPVEAYPVDWRTPRPDRRDGALLFSDRRPGHDRFRHARMGGLARLSPDRSNRGIVSGPISAASPAATIYLPILHCCGSILCPCAPSFGEGPYDLDRYARALIEQPAQAVVQAQSAKSDWAETALTLLFAAAAVLFVSFVAVVTGLV